MGVGWSPALSEGSDLEMALDYSGAQASASEATG